MVGSRPGLDRDPKLIASLSYQYHIILTALGETVILYIGLCRFVTSPNTGINYISTQLVANIMRYWHFKITIQNWFTVLLLLLSSIFNNNQLIIIVMTVNKNWHQFLSVFCFLGKANLKEYLTNFNMMNVSVEKDCKLVFIQNVQ